MNQADEQYWRDMKKASKYAWGSLVFAILSVCVLFSIVFFLLIHEWNLLILTVVVLISVVFVMVLRQKKIKSDQSEKKGYYEFALNRSGSFEELLSSFQLLDGQKSMYCHAENSAIISLNHKMMFRILMVYLPVYRKTDFDRMKASANRAYNKKHDISQEVPYYQAAKMMRINVIVTDSFTDELHRAMLVNAADPLSRAEGVLTVALADKKLLIPSVSGDVLLKDLNRYKKAVRLLLNTLIQTQK